MKFYIAERKLRNIQELTNRLLHEMRSGCQWVDVAFCGLYVSLTLAMPWARFYTRRQYRMPRNSERDRTANDWNESICQLHL